ncbi:MAG: S8 family serine peptidase, partial [Nitrosomonas sp.]|nr:S8 family serine peptidase [Nitrosomonas sp.]
SQVSSLKSQVILSPFSVFLLFVASTSLSLAAQYDAADYENLLNEANSKGFVRVLITLDDTVTLEDMTNKQASLSTAMENKAQNVLAELNQNTLKSGYWNNGIGQMGAYVNEIGLRVLAGSDNAISFARDVTHAYRIKAVDDDGSLDAIETAINTNGSANVDIFLNTDATDYDLDSLGNTVFKSSSVMSEQAQRILTSINTEHFAQGINVAEVDENRPVIRASIDRNAFYALIERDDVRAIRPVGYADPRKAQWPEEVLEAAKEHGEAEIMITLRGGDFSSAKTGYMSSAAIKAQANANQRAFDDILSKIGALASATDVSTSSEIGVLHIKFPFETLAKLYEDADARILSVELNKPVAWTTLTNSTALLNMSSAWSAGFRAAGQNIVIVDSGIRKNHAFLTPRVTFEACFGTNGISDGITYSTICPSPNATTGDSPLGLVNSGEPLSFTNMTACNALGSGCYHGTHVAGIAAGRQSVNISPSNLQGVGPDASIISAQVFSYKTTSPQKMTAFGADIFQALVSVLSATTAGTLNNPYTVNMSIGGALAPTNCNTSSFSINNTVSSLTSRGVPVVAATGNNGISLGVGSKTEISWPSCVPQVIKVSSVRNDSTGITLSGFANIASQSNYTGPILLAPGGGDGTNIRSAFPTSTTATGLMSGTSQAAPHVAGMYAAVKAASPGVSVADITAWVVSTGSIPVTVNLPAPAGNQVFRRVKVP